MRDAAYRARLIERLERRAEDEAWVGRQSEYELAMLLTITRQPVQFNALALPPRLVADVGLRLAT